MKDWELHLALQDPRDSIHDVIEAQLARLDDFEQPTGRDTGSNPGSKLSATETNSEQVKRL